MYEFNFYYAGTQSNRCEEFRIANSYNSLKSYFLDKTPLVRLIGAKKEGRYGGKIMVDSGAFTAHRKDVQIDCSAYIDYLNTNEPYLECYVQLDTIPGKFGQKRTREDILIAEQKSWENYLFMVDKLNNPYKLLPVFHQDEKFNNLQRILDFKIKDNFVPYICISGAKDKSVQERRDWYYECFKIIQGSKNKNVKVHCLGCSSYTDLVLFPFYSSDSTTWAQVAAVGGIADVNTIYVSDIALNNMENAERFRLLYPTIKNNCDKFNLDVEKLKIDSKERALYNMQFMNKWLSENIKLRKPLRFGNRRLF